MYSVAEQRFLAYVMKIIPKLDHFFLNCKHKFPWLPHFRGDTKSTTLVVNDFMTKEYARNSLFMTTCVLYFYQLLGFYGYFFPFSLGCIFTRITQKTLNTLVKVAVKISTTWKSLFCIRSKFTQRETEITFTVWPVAVHIPKVIGESNTYSPLHSW